MPDPSADPSPDPPPGPLPATDPARRAFLGTACTVGALLALGVPLSACSTPREGVTDPEAPASDAAAGAPASADAAPESGVAVTPAALTLTFGRPDTRALDAAGGALVVAEAGAVVVNDGGTLRAFSLVCPHTGCDIDRVEPAPAESGRRGPEIVCPCHGARFGLDGAVRQGPARRPLTPLALIRTPTGAIVALG